MIDVALNNVSSAHPLGRVVRFLGALV